MTPFRIDAALVLPGGSVDLRVAAGEVHELPDDDRVIAALASPQSDRRHRIVLDGRELGTVGRAARVRAGLVVLDVAEVAAEVSVHDHLAAVVASDAADALLAQVPRLAERRDRPAGVLSGGERRLLGWLVAAALEPRVVVLDRAGTGLDGASLLWVGRLVDRWVTEGAAVLVRVGRGEERRWLGAGTCTS